MWLNKFVGNPRLEIIDRLLLADNLDKEKAVTNLGVADGVFFSRDSCSVQDALASLAGGSSREGRGAQPLEPVPGK